MTATATRDREAARLFAQLEEGILGRDQHATRQTLLDLLEAGRDPVEILSETVRTHGPYTNVPYHQRVDGGVMRFVNNDHCMLSSRTSLNLPRYLPDELKHLPLAQTLWYVPTGLDPWNQLIGRMPGHYGRRTYKAVPGVEPPPPERHWEDQEPLHLEGTFEERLNEWLTLVERGEVVRAYRVFLGLFEETERRKELLAQLVFAGLIDVQGRLLYNRSYTTGHKAYRARATVELGQAVGWENAHHVLYAGVLDVAVGPRWHSEYEMACQVELYRLREELPSSSIDPTPGASRDMELFANDSVLSEPEAEGLIRALTTMPEPDYIEQIVALLLAGRGPRQILDTIQVAAANVILETVVPDEFSMPQHAYEYTNTVRWFYDTFEHPHRTKLLFVAGSFVNQAARWIANLKGHGRPLVAPPKGYDSLSGDQLLSRLDDALMALDKVESVAWTQAYLDAGFGRSPLVRTLTTAAVKHGNDPHNQEIGLCLTEDYGHSTSSRRDTLLLASAWHTAGHRKYGDSLESYRRFAEAIGVSASGEGRGEGDPQEAVLDQIEELPEPVSPGE